MGMTGFTMQALPAGHLTETEQTLSRVSDIAVYVALGMLTVALMAFAVHLAQHTTRRDAAARATRAAQTVGAGVGEGAGAAGVPAQAPGHDAAAQAEQQPSRRWGILGMQATWLATFAIAICVITHAVAVRRAPLGNMYEFALVTVLTSLAVYVGWSLRRELLWLGAFVSGVALLITGAAVVWWYVPAGPLMPALNDSIWLVIHVTTASISIGIFVVGGVLAALYLVKDRAESAAAENSEPVTGWTRAFPKAAVIERITYGIHIVAFPLFTFTLIAGAIWAEEAWGRYWNWDPKEIWSFVIWVVYAIYLHARATAGVSLRRSAWFALAGLGAIIINYTVVNTVIDGMHSYSGL